MPKKIENAASVVLVDSMVDLNKSIRARAAVAGKGKPDSAETVLLAKGKAEGLDGEELVLFIYRGVGGLVDTARAQTNRDNEERDRKRREARAR